MALGASGDSELLRVAGRIARALGMAVTTLETSEPDEILRAPADLIVVPLVRRGPHEVNQIPAPVERILARSDRPVLIVPVTGV
jgi:hypothetical protein